MAWWTRKSDTVSVANPEVGQQIIDAVKTEEVEVEREVSEAFILNDGSFISVDDIEKQRSQVVDLMKALQGSRQAVDEVQNRLELDTVDPPVDPEFLSALIKVDEVHFRCVRTKTVDSVGRRWDILPKTTRMGRFDAEVELDETMKKGVQEEIKTIREFVEEANEFDGFEGVIERACMDYESVGWAAIEVIRSIDMKVNKIAHVPAERVRVLKNKKGFVELASNNKKIYYQNFGEKVVSSDRKGLDGRLLPYRPRLDGKLTPGKLKWRLQSHVDGKPTGTFGNAANELLFIPKYHPGSVYYGIPDIMPAIAYVIGNVHIRNYFLQFFEHNAVPQYAIIITGARIADPVKQLIQQFFSQEVKGAAHKTLIIPVPGTGGEVKVTFEKLSVDEKEASFQSTKTNNGQSIMTAHGVSPAIIGINDSASLGSGKGISQAENYKNRIITPSQNRWERVLNNLFKLGLGVENVRIEFDPLDIHDEKEQMEILTGYQEHGDITIDEVRERAKLGDPIKGGNRAAVTVGSDIVFVDEMSAAQSSLYQKLDNAKEALQQRSQNKNFSPGNASSKGQTPSDTEARKGTGSKN